MGSLLLIILVSWIVGLVCGWFLFPMLEREYATIRHESTARSETAVSNG